jgi:hypothetical protein
MERGIGDNLISIFVNKEITKLYKSFLETVEDLKQENRTMVDKVAKHCAPEFADDINYFTNEKHNQLRKRILDNANDVIRNISSYSDLFDSTLNEKRLKEAVEQKRIIIKRFTTSTPLEIME